MHKKRAHFLFHALYGSPTKGYCGYMKRKCALYGRTLAHMPSTINIGRISVERLVSKMLICLCQLRLGAAVVGRPPYQFGGGFIETALPFSVTRNA